MGSSVLLLTDRSHFEQKWRSALQGTGLRVETIETDRLSQSLGNGSAVVIDAGCDVFDEDELLASVGLARALRAVTAVALPGDNAMSEIAELPPESIWVKFNEVDPDVWYVGSESISARKRARAKRKKRRK